MSEKTTAAKVIKDKAEESNKVVPLRALKVTEAELKKIRAAITNANKHTLAAQKAALLADQARVEMSEIVRDILAAHNAPPSWGIDDATGEIKPVERKA